MNELKDLLLESQRVSGTRKPITIVNPQKYNEFFEWLRDSDLRLQRKAFIAVTLSGGLRVSESLGLRPRHFDLEEGFFRFGVLKKKKKLTRHKVFEGKEITYHLRTNKVVRDAKLHPIARDILLKYIDSFGIKYNDRLFPFTRRAALNQIKSVLGPKGCVHSLRHSHFSWLLETEMVQKVAKLMEVQINVVPNYSHADKKALLNKLYGN